MTNDRIPFEIFVIHFFSLEIGNTIGMNLFLIYSIKIFNIYHKDLSDLEKGGQISIWHQVMPDRRQTIQKPDNLAKIQTYSHPSQDPLHSALYTTYKGC